MNTLVSFYRKACREIDPSPQQKALLLKLTREISVNIVQRQKTWNLKDDFLILWFISAGRYPDLAASPWADLIAAWVARQLPFELTEEERMLLCS